MLAYGTPVIVGITTRSYLELIIMIGVDHLTILERAFLKSQAVRKERAASHAEIERGHTPHPASLLK